MSKALTRGGGGGLPLREPAICVKTETETLFRKKPLLQSCSPHLQFLVYRGDPEAFRPKADVRKPKKDLPILAPRTENPGQAVVAALLHRHGDAVEWLGDTFRTKL